jgi:hypothetical protein
MTCSSVKFCSDSPRIIAASSAFKLLTNLFPLKFALRLRFKSGPELLRLSVARPGKEMGVSKHIAK